MKKDDKVRIAAIGAGWWGTAAHLPAIQKHARAQLVAVQHHDPKQATRIASDFGAAHACTTLDEVLGIKDLDAAVISSTPHLHYPQAKAALSRGLHVLIEKPMSLMTSEAQELVDLASRKGVQISISAPWHFTAHGIEARKLVRSGKLGQVKLISILMTNFVMGLYQGKPWQQVFGDNPTLQNSAKPYLPPGQTSYSDPKLAGGGQIYCQVSHAAAYVSFLTGRQPTEVFARFDNGGTQVDVHDALNFKLDDGAIVSLASTGAPMLSDRQYEVRAYGTEGMLLMELWKGTMEFHDRACNVTRVPDLGDANVYPMFAPTENFIDACAGAAENGSPGEHGLFAIKVLDAACVSARTGKNVKV
jgi:predicted dehydrogenase